jgi:MarR family transcriptional regulator, transcriptional regulator for hemolysin
LSTNTHELDAAPWIRVESTLMSTARTLREAFDIRFAPLNLNLTQAMVVAYVDEFGPINQTQIADHLKVGRAIVGATIDRLQDRQLLERRPDPDDRRVWQVAITPSGAATARQIADIDEVLRGELRAGISRQERSALAAVMSRLQSNLVLAINSTDQHPTTLNTAHLETP